METVLQDLRYAYRTLCRSRAFTATALAVLAVGIGATTTIYAVVRGVALKPLPFDEPERLMFVGEMSPAGRPEPSSAANILDVASQSRTLSWIALYRGARFVLTGGSVPEPVIGSNVSSTFFSVLRVQPQLGRAFLPEDEQTDRRAAMLRPSLSASSGSATHDLSSAGAGTGERPDPGPPHGTGSAGAGHGTGAARPPNDRPRLTVWTSKRGLTQRRLNKR